MSVHALLISNSRQHGGEFLAHCQSHVVEAFGPSAALVAFVPYARADHDDYAAIATAAFARMGYTCRSVHATTDPHALLAEARAVFVGGGNTFRLLARCQQSGLLDAIRRRVREGLVYSGASAGANLACPTIKTTNDMPIVMPRDFSALGLIPFQINPHYLDPDLSSTHMGETRPQRIAEFHEENSTTVVGLREGGVLRVRDGRLTVLGAPSLRIFERGRPAREIAAGAEASFLLASE
ncbi:MAG: dipeptidase PepE [Planctomycetota bacterium]